MAKLTGDSALALEAFKQGKDPMAEVYGKDYNRHDSDIVFAEEAQSGKPSGLYDGVINADDPGDDVLSLDQDSPEDDTVEDATSDATVDKLETSSEDDEADDSVDSESDGSTEMITITDAKGRREVEIDYNDHDKIKKYAKMAYGARKWQAERDAAREQLTTEQEAHSELQSNWKALETAFESQGVAGIIDLLENREGAYREFEQSIIERHELRRTATPEELEAIDGRDREARLQRQLETERKAREKFEAKVTQDRDAAEIANLQAMVNPVFEKYRFAGKLGNKVAEHKFDKGLYNDIVDALVPYEKAGRPITRALVERIARKESQETRAFMKEQTAANVKNAVKQKKREATENAQTKAMKGMKGSTKQQEAVELLNQPGGLSKLFKGWNSSGYGDAVTQRRRK